MPSRIHRTIVQTSVVIKRLPKPTTKNYEWQESAACRTVNPELFFHPDQERGPEKEERTKQAKLVCATCTVTKECLNFALSTRQDFGVWGGFDEEELYTIRTRRTRVRSE